MIMNETTGHKKNTRKRVMTPAIDGMTVKMERACLSEIRDLCPNINHQHVLSNGWTAGKFALCYVTGHHKKRKKLNLFLKQD
ncbi:FirrV-1-B18 [Feldmannia irregularis virus a]|uniref:FirrV-1-B18 n=1 Tax=Feldmannia irregularis virus a TaxID=231992 RepID=Q6XM18_9PHYC|nr:FirrV-1-B18 [Feldmannia irregularis virus a]AAR26893.1 FirrV-1-B18 [Feldmannia irregularis virus a]